MFSVIFPLSVPFVHKGLFICKDQRHTSPMQILIKSWCPAMLDKSPSFPQHQLYFARDIFRSDNLWQERLTSFHKGKRTLLTPDHCLCHRLQPQEWGERLEVGAFPCSFLYRSLSSFHLRFTAASVLIMLISERVSQTTCAIKVVSGVFSVLGVRLEGKCASVLH